MTEEHKKKISLSNKGRKVSLEGRKNISLSHIGHVHSDEQKKKIGLATKGEKHWNWQGGISGGWIKKHPEMRLIYKQTRRARIEGAGGSFSPQEWESLKDKYSFICLCCKRQEPEIKLTADHIVPLKMGGTSYIDNIQPLCKSCNSRKNANVFDYRKTFNLVEN